MKKKILLFAIVLITIFAAVSCSYTFDARIGNTTPITYYSDSSTPYVPINIAMYTEDKELVERIAQIIGTFMWFFLYLNKDMRTYTQSMNDLLLNKNLIRDLPADRLPVNNSATDTHCLHSVHL